MQLRKQVHLYIKIIVMSLNKKPKDPLFKVPQEDIDTLSEVFKKHKSVEVLHISLPELNNSTYKKKHLVDNGLTFYMRRYKENLVMGFQFSFKGYVKKTVYVKPSKHFKYRWNNKKQIVTISNFVTSLNPGALDLSLKNIIKETKKFKLFYL